MYPAEEFIVFDLKFHDSKTKGRQAPTGRGGESEVLSSTEVYELQFYPPATKPTSTSVHDLGVSRIILLQKLQMGPM